MDYVKEGTPSNEELEEVAVEIGDSWESLGRRLKFGNAQLTGFHKENEKYSEKAYKMMLAWKERNGRDASYQILYDALCHHLVGHKDLASKFCCDKDEVVSKGRGKRLFSNTGIQASKQPKLVTGTHNAVLFFRDLKQLRLDVNRIGKEADLFKDLKQNAGNKGFIISNNPGGGNCMFYSLAEQLQLVKGISISQGELRRKLVAFLWKNPKLANGTDLFNFIAEYSSWTDYLKHIEKDGTWGDHVVLVAAANCFQVPIQVISSLQNRQDLFIHPESPVNHYTPLVLGHVHELHYVSLRSLQVYLTEFQSGEHQPSSAGTASHPQNELRKLIKDVYIRGARLWQVPWCDKSVLLLERVYTRLTMKARKVQTSALTSQEVEMYDIFCSHKDCRNPRSVLVEGDPGIGKTFFCLKMAYDWATGTISPYCSFPDVELVLLLKCRDLHSGVQKAIEDQFYPKDFTDQEKRSCLKYLQQIQEKLLLILDGLDELPEHASEDVNDVIFRKIFPRSFLVVTARQERGIHVRKEFDTLLEIKGFTKRDAGDYITRHFQDKGMDFLARALIEEIGGYHYIFDVWFPLKQRGKKRIDVSEVLKNPLNTVLLCLVFEDCKGKLPSTRAELYQSIVFCRLKWFCTKKGIPVNDSTLFKQFEDVLIGLGKLALDGLKEDCMYFSEKKLNSSTHEVPQIGFVSKEGSTKMVKSEHNYSFPHKTFQEFFAALYLAHLLKTDATNLYEFIPSIGDIEGRFKQVLTFVAGILGKDGGHYFELLGRLIKEKGSGFEHPWEFLLDSFKESGHIKNMAAAIARSMSMSDLVIEGDVTLNVLDYSGVQSDCECKGHNELRDTRNLIVTIGDVVLPSGLDKFLAKNTSLYSLALRTHLCCANDACRLNNAVLASLGKGLSENTSLTSLTLDMSRCDLNDATLPFLGKGLSESTSLTSLTLKMSGCDLNDATLDFLSKGLSENTSLTSLTLDMSHCRRNDAMLASLGKDLSKNKSLTSLTLDLSHCHLNDASLASLSKGFSGNTSLTSLTLDLSACRLNDAALAFLGKGLSENTSLKSLTLDRCNRHLNHSTLASLSKRLLENTLLASLTLNMSGCVLIDATLASLGKGLLENTSLTSLTLNMFRSHLNGATLASLGKGLSDNISLASLTLDMSWCNLDDFTIAYLVKGLSENTSVTSLNLNLSGSTLIGAALALPAKGFSENTTLTSLNLNMSGSILLNASLILLQLAKGLSEITSLTSLTLNTFVLDPKDATISSIRECLSRTCYLCPRH